VPPPPPPPPEEEAGFDAAAEPNEAPVETFVILSGFNIGNSYVAPEVVKSPPTEIGGTLTKPPSIENPGIVKDICYVFSGTSAGIILISPV
jgi:hypothetical protein